MSPEHVLLGSAMTQEFASEVAGETLHPSNEGRLGGHVCRRNRGEHESAVCLILQVDRVALAPQGGSCDGGLFGLFEEHRPEDFHAESLGRRALRGPAFRDVPRGGA
jgi:hypothetical protein